MAHFTQALPRIVRMFYNLKKKFRLLASIDHPNVVAVHELFAEHGKWFFTMEAVDGQLIDRFWRSASGAGPFALVRS
jgi:hypothetical protein